jgi:hypothetical protein
MRCLASPGSVVAQGLLGGLTVLFFPAGSDLHAHAVSLKSSSA